ncbi:hypothetical protein FSP39_023991 [Pinctada imbricata]|uniref:Small-subunit processome Utp12 domain-containing protein n=1 Tax=Pinctada imbricata TaxID=66713 RepID=A0AA88XX53_PINIB|nr:hypothetical protein FSP39_023991 [Pinctada imbricata]
MATSTVAPFSISENGELAIYSSPDGILKLWDTTTGALKQEYTPSSHLSATCSCLSWGPKRNLETPRKKKKKKSLGGVKQLAEFDMVAVGTTAGNILLYSIVQGDIQSILDGGHSDVVNDTCWCPDDTLISCSSDQHIVHWDVSSAKVKHKWKADTRSIHSVCLCSNNHLLSAGRSIKLWNLQTYQVLKKFTGHSSEIFKLLPLPLSADMSDSVEGSYFLTAALSDRLVNAWTVDTSSKDKSAVASFSLPEEPVMLDVGSNAKDSQVLLLAVVTRGGQVLVFEHTPNGKLKKPVHPKVTIQVATSGENDSVPHPIQILAAHVCDDSKNILLIHGNYLKPTFEKIKYDNSNSNVCLLREDPRLSSIENQASISRIKTPNVSKDLTVLAPAVMVPTEPSEGTTAKRLKRKTSVTDMNMEERLNAISIESTDSVKEPPKADTLVRLLAQGLQSGDKKILNSVLGKSSISDLVMRNTVKKLPVHAVLPLVKELITRMQGHAQHGLVIVRWIKTVLTVHTSFLITNSDIVENLGLLYQMMDSRTTMFTKLSHLQGKLDLMLSQVVSQEEKEDSTEGDQRPLLMYQEDSSESDGDLTMDDILPDHSDAEVDDTDIFGSDTEGATDLNMQDKDEEMESD